MILDSFGIKETEKHLSKLLEATPEEGSTSFIPFLKVAKKFGLECVEKKKATIKDLKKLANQDYRIIVCYMDLKDRKEQEGHYSVVKKIENKKIYLYDPYYGPNNHFSLSYFNRIWKDKEIPDDEKGWLIAMKK
jgi:ABC-type bacteriocin/lantibiotic exporter with double-glycine peptidase domain